MQDASPCYRIPADALVACWAGDRLLVFSRCDENTHVLAPAAGRLVVNLLSQDGAPLSAQAISRSCTENELLQDPVMVEHLLNDLQQAGLVERWLGS